MVEYGLRTRFRIAAWFPGLAFLAMGVASIVVGYRAASTGPIVDGWMILVGLAVCVPAFFFLRIAWTGRVPAFVEEYGLDDRREIETFRAEARRQGRLYE